MDKTEFWNNINFWASAFITYLVAGLCAFVLAIVIWDERVWSNRQENYLTKSFLYKAASGETVDEKAAYLSGNIMDVRTGIFFHDEIKKGVKFEEITKRIEETVNELAKLSGNKKSPEEYKTYLRSRYNTPEAILYLADGDRWKKFSGKEDNVNELKQALTGSAPKLKEPDYYEGIKGYILSWFFLVQFLAYGIAFYTFKKEEYRGNKSYLDQAHIGLGGFMSFLVFIPGALPIIIVQVAMIYWYRSKKAYVNHQNKIEKRKSAVKSFDLGADSGQQLLEKLKQRVQ